jgi:ribokinase
MTHFDVVSIGSAVQDTFIRSKEIEETHSKKSESGQMIMLPVGAKIDVDLMQHEIGGAATNSSVAFSRVGLEATLISRIGQDWAGRLVKERLEEENIRLEYVTIDPADVTGQSVLLLSPDGNRTVLVARGASQHFEIEDVEEGLLRRTSWVYLSSIAGNISVLRRVFGLGHLHQVKIAWNPGGMELAMGQRALQPFLRQAAIVIMNREEAAELTNLPHHSLKMVVEKLAALSGNGMVVVTDGAAGAAAFDGHELITLPSRNVKVADATGAGDSFGSGFVAATILGKPLELALSFGLDNAESVIGKIGAQPGLLRRAELDQAKVRRGIGHQPM